MNLKWSQNSAKDFLYFKQNAPEKLQRISELIGDIQRHAYEGLGDPTPLSHHLSGYWSRRIDRLNRLVYKVEGDNLIIAQCRFHL